MLREASTAPNFAIVRHASTTSFTLRYRRDVVNASATWRMPWRFPIFSSTRSERSNSCSSSPRSASAFFKYSRAVWKSPLSIIRRTSSTYTGMLVGASFSSSSICLRASSTFPTFFICTIDSSVSFTPSFPSPLRRNDPRRRSEPFVSSFFVCGQSVGSALR